MCSTMVVAVGGWRLAAVGGWQLATGGWWRLVVVGGGWWLAVGGWRQLAVVGSWRLVAAGGGRRLVAGGWWRLVVGGWWRLAVDGSWRLAVGGPLGLSLRAVLSKKKKKSRSLRTPLVGPGRRLPPRPVHVPFAASAPTRAPTTTSCAPARGMYLNVGWGGGWGGMYQKWGRGVGWEPPPPRVPLWSPPKAGRKLLKLKSSWHRKRPSKFLGVSLKHWKGRKGGGVRGGGGVAPLLLRCPAVLRKMEGMG